MFASALVCLCVAGSFVATDSIEIPIKHRRPTKIMQLLLLDGTDTGFMPEGVSANANDAGRLIVAKGPAKGLDEFRELIALFDKLPSTIKVRVVVDSVYDAEDYVVTAEIRNNSSFVITATEAGVRLSLQCRVNGDGSITSTAGYSLASRQFEMMTIRDPVGTPLVLAPPFVEVKEESGKTYYRLQKNLARGPIVTITVLSVK